jgi:integrase
LEKSTQSTYSNVMDDHVLPRWKTIPLAAVEFEDVQAWIAELVASGLSGAHVRKIHFVLAGVLQLAVKGKRLPANPAKGVDLPRAKSKDKKYLNVEEVEAMAAAAGAVARNAPRRGSFAGRDQYRLAVYVLAYCGLRWSEIAAMRANSIDLRRRRMHVKAAVVKVDHHGLVWGTPKSHEARWVPIPGFLADELNTYLAGSCPTICCSQRRTEASCGIGTRDAGGSTGPRSRRELLASRPTNCDTPPPASRCGPAPTSRRCNEC